MVRLKELKTSRSILMLLLSFSLFRCAASGSDCPLTSIKVLDSTSSDYVAADWSSTSQLDGNYLLVSRNASTTTSSELPVQASVRVRARARVRRRVRE